MHHTHPHLIIGFRNFNLEKDPHLHSHQCILEIRPIMDEHLTHIEEAKRKSTSDSFVWYHNAVTSHQIQARSH